MIIFVKKKMASSPTDAIPGRRGGLAPVLPAVRRIKRGMAHLAAQRLPNAGHRAGVWVAYSGISTYICRKSSK